MNQVEVKRRQIQSFSYVLACINIWVFGKSIGDNGLGYLAAAVLVFALFWVLTGKNLPDRMGRMLRGRNARGQYRNVSRMRKNMMLLQIAEGLLGTVSGQPIYKIIFGKHDPVDLKPGTFSSLYPVCIFRIFSE